MPPRTPDPKRTRKATQGKAPLAPASASRPKAKEGAKQPEVIDTRRLTMDEKKALFLQAFAQTQNFGQACQLIGYSRSQVHKWKREDEGFKEDFDNVFQSAIDKLEAVLLKHAIEGWLEPVYQQGLRVGLIRKWDHSLGMWLLSRLRPEIYSAKVAEQGDIESKASLVFQLVQARAASQSIPAPTVLKSNQEVLDATSSGKSA